ncbi:hypothetical protein RB195_009047 [Necator americanus]|uniref:Protein yippee-like n=1 Tax=Necator americanus TaxID=51031 RepID=A0ABR1CRI8_NECAM
MPRVFLEHWGGRRTFSCEKCGTYLSNRQEVVSTRDLRDGTRLAPAASSWNRAECKLIFDVRDVFCLVCDTKLGWLYEFTHENTERYKEGKCILERRLVREMEVTNNQLAERLFEHEEPASPAKLRLNWKRL